MFREIIIICRLYWLSRDNEFKKIKKNPVDIFNDNKTQRHKGTLDRCVKFSSCIN